MSLVHDYGVKALGILIGIGMLGFFAFILYQIALWMLFGAGFPILVLAAFIVLILMIGQLPELLAHKTGQTRWAAERTLQLLMLFGVGVVIGAYWIPTQMKTGVAWYWRILLGAVVGWLALATRRFR